MPDDMRIDAPDVKTGKETTSPRIAILGAGFSGMGMAIRLRQEGFDNFTIYEKADEVGGTWRENRYPGVACDVPSHLYSFSFDPNPKWTRRFSSGPEILDYMKTCAEKFDLYRSIAFGKEVSAIKHDGAEWTISFKDGSTAGADFVVSGLGGLHKPNIPDFKGVDTFKGPVFHTAEWPDNVDLKGKRVAIIGSAASAIQIIPEIVDDVAHLDVYQRTPNWIIPREDYGYPKWVRSLFSAAPWLARAYRGFYFSVLEWRFPAFHKEENRIKQMTRDRFAKYLENSIADPALRTKLTPDYPIGCKRILISDDYFRAIQKPNVDLVTEGIDGFVEHGVITRDGKLHEADVVILATGFKPFDILDAISVAGPSGASLKDTWRQGIAAHRTVMAPGFPNFFLLLGPNSALGHNSVILMIEAQVNYVIQLIKQAASAGQGRVAQLEPSAEAARAFDATIQGDLQKRVWAAGCGAWYVDENGRNYTLYPHSVRRYLKDMKIADLSEYVMKVPA
ncbi:NAD(P)/FAD-dependent oxidoreductase [Hyphococcus flavus]|uniref:NAD(P)/FAD-dependent oxidoreductase n=1 Tax=Hyphococcus flavus TaxID=1866326 RepID=A0AAE9ZGD9_9PROT|nr:NAD(P)/FAD-dependent oxidoreductase [Hyphococcus flavus]WDI30366.1 NAD(P)/FAD-dependent oxidoreductase [Hyphococcus flavus]